MAGTKFAILGDIHGNWEAFFVVGEGYKVSQGDLRATIKMGEFRVHKSMGDFACTIGAEVHENDDIARGNRFGTFD